jgi:hypothetical protein
LLLLLSLAGFIFFVKQNKPLNIEANHKLLEINSRFKHSSKKYVHEKLTET